MRGRGGEEGGKIKEELLIYLIHLVISTIHLVISTIL